MSPASCEGINLLDRIVSDNLDHDYQDSNFVLTKIRFSSASDGSTSTLVTKGLKLCSSELLNCHLSFSNFVGWGRVLRLRLQWIYAWPLSWGNFRLCLWSISGRLFSFSVDHASAAFILPLVRRRWIFSSLPNSSCSANHLVNKLFHKLECFARPSQLDLLNLPLLSAICMINGVKGARFEGTPSKDEDSGRDFISLVGMLFWLAGSWMQLGGDYFSDEGMLYLVCHLWPK